jgi:hypothetical protein
MNLANEILFSWVVFCHNYALNYAMNIHNEIARKGKARIAREEASTPDMI